MPNYCARVRACACSLSPPGWLTLARGLYFLFRACLLRRLVCFVRSFVGRSVCVCVVCRLSLLSVLFCCPRALSAGASASCSSSSGDALFRVFEARRRAVQKWLSEGLFGAAVFPYLQRASFLSGPAPASRVASGGHHGSQRPAFKILESFGGVAAWPRCSLVCML